jgi:outer membrane protein
MIIILHECAVKVFSLSFLFFCASVGLCSEESHELSLAEAQAAALVHSEELSIAELETLIASEKIQEIRGINLPKLTVDGSYNLRNNDAGFVRKNPAYKKEQSSPPHMPGMPSSSHPPIPPKKIKTIATEKEVTNGKVSLIVPVYDFGYVSNLVKAQTSIVEATVYEKARVQQDLLFAVANNFYRALEGSKIETVVLESMRALGAQLATAEDLFSVGLVTKNDVLVVEVQLAERQQELIQARHNIESALCSLTRLTGRRIAIVSELGDIDDVVAWNESVDSIIAQADVVHPVLKKIQANTTAAAFDMQATKAENYPDINAFVNFHSSSDSYLLHKNWVHGGVCIEIPIFDGGIVDSKVAQKRKQISVLDLQYSEAVEDIHLAIRKAFLQVDSAFHQIPVAQKSIQLAEDNLMISKDLFQEGLIMSDDVLNDESRLAQARSNYYQSLYDFYIARSELEYAAGLIKRQGTEYVG